MHSIVIALTLLITFDPSGSQKFTNIYCDHPEKSFEIHSQLLELFFFLVKVQQPSWLSYNPL